MAKEITIYAKKRTSSDGRNFYTFLTTLTKKNGEEQMVEVKFTDEAGSPNGALCPMNIIVQKANMVDRRYDAEITDKATGEVVIESRVAKRMWVSEWRMGSEYVDHSMDDYEGF